MTAKTPWAPNNILGSVVQGSTLGSTPIHRERYRSQKLLDVWERI